MERVARLARDTLTNISRPYMKILPGQLAFFFLVSLIPLIALVGVVASSFSISIDTLALVIEQNLPGDITHYVLEFISGEGLTFNMIIFLASAFLLASNGAQSMIITSNIIYNFETKKMIRRRIKAILMTIVIVGIIFFLLVVPVFGNFIFDMLREYSEERVAVDVLYNLYSLLKYPITILILYLSTKLLYTVSPDQKIPTRTTIKGSIFTAIAWLGATEVFSVYVSRFTNYDIFYGSISNILILLLWIYLLAYIFVLGMAFNAGVYDMMIRKKANTKTLEETLKGEMKTL